MDGPEAALQDVPWGEFGKLLTVDRQEIESLRSMRNLVFEYCKQGPQKRPLSVAVFSPLDQANPSGSSKLPIRSSRAKSRCSSSTSPSSILRRICRPRFIRCAT